MTAIDTTPAPATTPSAVMRSFLPGIGIMTWKDAQPRIPYCSASASSVGTALLQTKGASWLAVVSFGFILVVNAPQNMLAYGTETFAAGFRARRPRADDRRGRARDAARHDLLALGRLRLSRGLHGLGKVARAKVDGMACGEPARFR